MGVKKKKGFQHKSVSANHEGWHQHPWPKSNGTFFYHQNNKYKSVLKYKVMKKDIWQRVYEKSWVGLVLYFFPGDVRRVLQMSMPLRTDSLCSCVPNTYKS